MVVCSRISNASPTHQVTDVADALVLETLFTALIKKGVRLVMTSNRPPDELYVGGLNRQHFLPFIQLLKKYLEIHHLVLPAACDYRKKHAGHRAIFFLCKDTYIVA
jgi:cell division protein ZapE